MVKICEVVDNCEECPRYGDDCDGDKMAEHTDLISRADAIDAVRKCDGEICGEDQPFTGFAEFENRKEVEP